MTVLQLFLLLMYIPTCYGFMFVAMCFKELNGIKEFCVPIKGYKDYSDVNGLKDNLSIFFLLSPITFPLFVIVASFGFGFSGALWVCDCIVNVADPSLFSKPNTNKELEELRKELAELRAKSVEISE